jgi:hypothetical protein
MASSAFRTVLTLPMILAFMGPLSSCGTEHSKQRAAVSKLNELVGKANEAAQFGRPWRDANDTVPESVLQKMQDYNVAFVRESNDIDVEVLNAVYPNLGVMFRDKFVKSMSMSVEVADQWINVRRSGGKLVMTPELQQNVDDSKRLENEWAVWFNSHFDDINKALSRTDP